MRTDLRYATFWAIGGWIMILVVIVTCLLPGPDIAAVAGLLPDKVEHALAYFALTLWFCGLYPRSSWWKLAALFFLLGVFIEIAQGLFTTTRAMEVNDAVADTVGILAGLLIARAGAARWCAVAETFLPAARN